MCIPVCIAEGNETFDCQRSRDKLHMYRCQPHVMCRAGDWELCMIKCNVRGPDDQVHQLHSGPHAHLR